MTSVYIIYGKDSLPMYVADSIKELAILSGIKRTSLNTIFSKIRHNHYKSEHYAEVQLEDEE